MSVNINCICHFRGSDTPGITALHFPKTHFQTKICLSYCFISEGISIVPFNRYHTNVHKHIHTPFTPLLSLNLIHLIQGTFFPPLSFLPPLLSRLSTDQGSACIVSISHVSFLPGSLPLIQGQGMPSSHFPSLSEHGCSGWPYLLSLLSQTLAGGGPLIASQPL